VAIPSISPATVSTAQRVAGGAAPKAAPAAAPAEASSEPKDTFQASTPQVTGSWLAGQLKNTKPGAMFVLDDFQPTGGQAIPGPFAGPEWLASHGGAVLDTAKKEGFPGQTIPLEINRPLSDDQLQQKYGQMTELWNNGKTPEDLRKSLYERALVNRTRLLDNATESLNDLSGAGAHDSVVNISASGTQAATVDRLLKRMVPTDRENPESVAAARAERAKFAQAFGVSDADLSSDNADVQGAARQKMFQGVVDLVAQTQTDPNFVSSKAAYEGAVTRFEGGNNSVVVAAGNEGGVQKFWEDATSGRSLKVPADFTRNDLGSSEATVVGATRDWKGQAYPAEYNNSFQGVDVYANGYAHDGSPKADEGTSYAAPRVASAMGGLHGKFPGMSSSQIENLMRQQLTGSLPDYYGSQVLPVLDEKHTMDFLAQGTF